MKKITRVIPARKVVRYQCKHCKNKYRDRKRALQCEAQPVEPQEFFVGDRVTWCENKHCSRRNLYTLDGIIKDVLGPTLPDEDYNHLCLDSKLSGKHVFEYVVHWTCPYCNRALSQKFYGVELKKL